MSGICEFAPVTFLCGWKWLLTLELRGRVFKSNNVEDEEGDVIQEEQ